MEVGNGDNEGWIPDQVGNDNGGYTAGKETSLNNSLSISHYKGEKISILILVFWI